MICPEQRVRWNAGHRRPVGALLWLFPPAWGAVEPALKVGFACPFVVVDPTDSFLIYGTETAFAFGLVCPFVGFVCPLVVVAPTNWARSLTPPIRRGR